jgi:arylsulfatase A-like enzyme
MFLIRLGLVLSLGLWAAAARCAEPRPLNVIVVIADDLGWTDLGCFGSDYYLSPHLDRLAADGMRFTANYSACTVCSPTRAALLTGKSPARLHVTDWIPGQMPANPRLLVPDFTKHLPLEETTLAEALREAGYATASIGKWHLGGPDFYPERHGFDLNVAGSDAPQPRPGYFAPYDIPTLKEREPGEYVTDRLGDEAEAFVRASAGRPFFLYLAHFAVHTPIEARRPDVRRHEDRLRPDRRHRNAAYAAMIESMDRTIGQLRETLDELDVADRTAIVFTSDNGGRVPTTSNAPLRVGKGSAYEGGVRVPLIVYWPGVTQPGSQCATPVITMDLYPTILDLLGLPARPEQTVDGVSLAPLVRGDGQIAERSLFWHYPHYQHYQQGGATPYSAVRHGDYRLIEFLADGRTELYNVTDDVGEMRDLAGESPQRVAELRAELDAWRREAGAQMPTPNPDYDPAQPEDTRPAARRPRS